MERPTAFTLGKKTQWQRVTFEKNTWYIELLCSTKDDAAGLPLNPESDGSLPAPVGQNINLLYLSGLVPTAENVEDRSERFFNAAGEWVDLTTSAVVEDINAPIFLGTATTDNKCCITVAGGYVKYETPTTDMINEGVNNEYYTPEKVESEVALIMEDGDLTTIKWKPDGFLIMHWKDRRHSL